MNSNSLSPFDDTVRSMHCDHFAREYLHPFAANRFNWNKIRRWLSMWGTGHTVFVWDILSHFRLASSALAFLSAEQREEVTNPFGKALLSQHNKPLIMIKSLTNRIWHTIRNWMCRIGSAIIPRMHARIHYKWFPIVAIVEHTCVWVCVIAMWYVRKIDDDGILCHGLLRVCALCALQDRRAMACVPSKNKNQSTRNQFSRQKISCLIWFIDMIRSYILSESNTHLPIQICSYAA